MMETSCRIPLEREMKVERMPMEMSCPTASVITDNVAELTPKIGTSRTSIRGSLENIIPFMRDNSPPTLLVRTYENASKITNRRRTLPR